MDDVTINLFLKNLEAKGCCSVFKRGNITH